jgi:hypothetical protein
MLVVFKHPLTGQLKTVKVGFNWLFLLTTPFYGVGLFIRGLVLHGLIAAGVALVTVLLGPAMAPVSGAALIVTAIIYGAVGNKLLAHHLLSRGWTMEGDAQLLAFAKARWGILQ